MPLPLGGALRISSFLFCGAWPSCGLGKHLLRRDATCQRVRASRHAHERLVVHEVSKDVKGSAAARNCEAPRNELFVYLAYVKWPRRIGKYLVRHLANRGWGRPPLFKCRHRGHYALRRSTFQQAHLLDQIQLLRGALELRVNAFAFALQALNLLPELPPTELASRFH